MLKVAWQRFCRAQQKLGIVLVAALLSSAMQSELFVWQVDREQHQHFVQTRQQHCFWHTICCHLLHGLFWLTASGLNYNLVKNKIHFSRPHAMKGDGAKLRKFQADKDLELFAVSPADAAAEAVSNRDNQVYFGKGAISLREGRRIKTAHPTTHKQYNLHSCQDSAADRA
jgi:hypothetical protein